MSPSKPFSSPLEASSFYLPGGSSLYTPLRTRLVQQLTEMGYDPTTMTECGINWGEDQDPFGHVANSVYPRYMATCNMRVVESFAEVLGKEKFGDLMGGKKGVGALVKSFQLEIKSPAVYPDALIVAHRMTEMLPDRYLGITSIWSLRRQSLIAEMKGYVVFYDHEQRKPADLVQAGGVHTDLHASLTKRVKESNERVAKWESDHPKTLKAKI